MANQGGQKRVERLNGLHKVIAVEARTQPTEPEFCVVDLVRAGLIGDLRGFEREPDSWIDVRTVFQNLRIASRKEPEKTSEENGNAEKNSV